ncbi:MAG: hypothetical protein LBU14_04565 [Candidatus Peribacteria bacterium]|jgi:hypothetical protein|nr:hypothetical protein [Candidatus Peribacteria bacterium]
MEFEALFQKFSLENFCPNIVYFSLLRQFYEIRIMEMFVKYKKYLHIFSSCNRNFRVHKDRPKTLWCGECPKCVFAWILLSAFLEKDELVSIFQKNLYKDENLLPLFNNILGYGKMKPFDCVGTFEESQAAFYMAIEKFKEGVYNSSESRTANSMSQEKFT